MTSVTSPLLPSHLTHQQTTDVTSLLRSPGPGPHRRWRRGSSGFSQLPTCAHASTTHLPPNQKRWGTELRVNTPRSDSLRGCPWSRKGHTREWPTRLPVMRPFTSPRLPPALISRHSASPLLWSLASKAPGNRPPAGASASTALGPHPGTLPSLALAWRAGPHTWPKPGAWLRVVWVFRKCGSRTVNCRPQQHFWLP